MRISIALTLLLTAAPTALLAQELTLEEELAAMQRELEAEQPTDDPFTEGRIPDLMIISTTDLRGEIRPCG